METLISTRAPEPSVPPVTPAPVADPAWDAAFLRIESYLRAHHIESRVLLNHLATDVMRQTRVLAANRPGEDIVMLAMEVAHARIGQWLVRIFPDGDWTDERFRARGRLALLLADVPGKWAANFLSPEPLPEDLGRAMRTCAFQAGPELRFTNMPPTPVDELFGEDADPARPPAWRFPIIRGLLGSLLVLGLAGLAWATFV